MLSSGQVLNVDFTALAIADPDFAAVYEANNGHVDFQDPQTVQQLTKSILKHDFNLEVELPSDRLCPPVPVRYKYICWLQGLVDTTGRDYEDDYNQERVIRGLDIGVGASCIYPLLGCATRPNWTFSGTDIDDRTLEYARKNVQLNDFQSRIRLAKVDPNGSLLDLTALGTGPIDFTMCNPPFYTSKEEMYATHSSKTRSPSAICTGSDLEMIVEGGDLGFTRRILEESQTLRGKVQWYSSMLGKLSSAQAMVALIKAAGVTNWALTSLQAGSVTKRWAIAWSYRNLRPSNDVARGDTVHKGMLPFPTEYTLIPGTWSIAAVHVKLRRILDSLQLCWVRNEDSGNWLVCAQGNVWSRAARRRQRRHVGEHGRSPHRPTDDASRDSTGSVLVVRISAALATNTIVIRWLEGADVVLFESFCGMLKTMLG